MKSNPSYKTRNSSNKAFKRELHDLVQRLRGDDRVGQVLLFEIPSGKFSGKSLLVAQFNKNTYSSMSENQACGIKVNQLIEILALYTANLLRFNDLICIDVDNIQEWESYFVKELDISVLESHLQEVFRSYSEGLTKNHYINVIPGNKLQQPNQRNLPLSYTSHAVNLDDFQFKMHTTKSFAFWECCVAAYQILLCRYSNQTKTSLHIDTSSSRGVGTKTTISVDLKKSDTIDELLMHNRIHIGIAAQCRILSGENTSSPLLNASQFCNSIVITECSQKKFVDSLNYFKDDRESLRQINAEEIRLHINSHNGVAEICWIFNSNKYSPDFIHSVAEAYNVLLHNIATESFQKTSNIPMLRPELVERFCRFNTTVMSQKDAVSFPLLFSRQVQLNPNSTAVVYKDKDNQTSLTYGELESKSNQLANFLLENGNSFGTRIGVHLNYHPNILVAMLAISKIQAEYVPLDPEYPKERLSFMMEDAGVSCLITQKEHRYSPIEHDANDLKGAPQNKFSQVSIIVLDADGFEKQLASYSTDTPVIDSHGIDSSINDIAYIIYTSGTTGRPKGVLGSHKSLTNRLVWMDTKYPVIAETRFASTASICFVDHIAEVLQPLVSGGVLHMFPKKVANDVDAFSRAIEEFKIQRMTIIPSQLSALLKHQNNQALNSLELVITSGEPLFQNIADAFYLQFNEHALLLNLYGMTEAGADVSFNQVAFPEHLRVLKYFRNNHSNFNSVKNTSITKNDEFSIQNISEFDDYITVPDVSLEQLTDKFSETNIPAHPTQFKQYMNTLKRDLIPYMVNVSSEKFIGHMTSALPDFMPEFSRFITQANQNVVKIETSKALTLMERQLMAMLHRLFFRESDDYYACRVQDPNHMFGIVTSGGSLANITSLYVARNKSLLQQGITKAQLQKQGAIGCLNELGYRRAVILVSQLAHYSIRKTVGLLGLGEDNLITIEQDEDQRIDTVKLEKTIADCKKNNDFIIAVIGIAGATETGTVDPLPQMAEIAKQYNIHFHVDAAWGGAFMFSEDYRYKLAGIEQADTITFCAHKQLYLAQGISLCILKDPQSLFSVTTHADYQAALGSFDLGQFTLEGSRPGASLMLHAALHLFSRSGYGWLIEQSMRKAAFLREVIEGSDCFELVGDNDLNIINYRYIPISLRGMERDFSEAEHQLISSTTEQIQEVQFLQGRSFVSKTRIVHSSFSKGKIGVFRVVPINPLTSFDDLVDVLNDQLEIASNQIERTGTKQSMNLRNSVFSSLRPVKPVVPIGKSIENTIIYILDSNFNLLPPGAIGEICIAGDGLSPGYLNLPELTKKHFISNPYSTSNENETLYRTGDLGRWNADGSVEFCGRVDHQIKLHGNRIELDEIELIVTDFPEVDNAKIAIIKDDTTSNIEGAEECIIAYVQLKTSIPIENCDAFKQRLTLSLSQHLPQDHIPQIIHILDQIPKLPNGKVDLNLCEQKFHQTR